VAVSGGGPIGLLAADAARAAGATTVALAEPVERKRELAAERGADLVVDAAERDLAEAVREEHGAGADVVIEASGAEPAVAGTVDVARRGGTVVLVGLAAEAEVPLDVLAIVDKELDVHGSFRYANTYPTAVETLADGRVDAAGLIDFDADLDGVAAAFERAADPGTVKGMVTF
jgi:L-iditol 2-dehydrogenase